jgi:excisionase family DNA binding protein
MDKESAASFLNVSVRTLQRWTKQGKISIKYKHGKSGATADYNEQELATFKEELENTTYTPATAENQALAPVNRGAEQLLALLDKLRPEAAKPTVSVADKLILDLKEAQELTHLSRADLVTAIKTGKLKGSKRGRGWKIKRAELDEFVRNL